MSGDFTLGSTWEGSGSGKAPEEPTPQEQTEALTLSNATIEKNALGHYYIVGFLPGDIRVAGWLHERPLPAKSVSAITRDPRTAR